MRRRRQFGYGRVAVDVAIALSAAILVVLTLAKSDWVTALVATAIAALGGVDARRTWAVRRERHGH